MASCCGAEVDLFILDVHWKPHVFRMSHPRLFFLLNLLLNVIDTRSLGVIGGPSEPLSWLASANHSSDAQTFYARSFFRSGLIRDQNH